MGFSNVSSLTRIDSYEDCARLFNKPAPLSRMGWHADERPLKDARFHHYKVQRSGDCYDVILYSTVMARYFKPEGNTRKVWYNVDARQTSSAFMYHVLGLWPYRVYLTLQGTRVHVGVNLHASGLFPIRLTFVDGKLDLVNSTDAPDFKASTTSDERKQERKELRKWLRPYEAMVKVVEPARNLVLFGVAAQVATYRGTDKEFDPTHLVECIRVHGVKKLIDECLPLGDVHKQHPPFMEAS